MENNFCNQEEYEVEAIIGHRIKNGKNEYRVKWAGFNRRYSTWEPQENLIHCQEKLTDYVSSKKKEIEMVFGCTEREGVIYFLVKFKGEVEKQIIDWQIAKEQPLIFMEYFASRLTWPPIHECMDPNDKIVDDGNIQQQPNDIEWDI